MTPMQRMLKPKEVKELVELEGRFDVVSYYKGTYTAKKGYFYKFGMTPESLAEKVKKVLPYAKIHDTGDHFHAFVGGAKTGGPQDSYMWVKFSLPDGPVSYVLANMKEGMHKDDVGE